MIKAIVTSIAVLMSINTFGQHLIKGVLLSKKDELPIPFASVGIRSVMIGTITNEDGSFELEVPSGISDDMLTFSTVGYESKSISIAKFNNSEQAIVYLEEKITELAAVVVNSRKISRLRNIKLGNSDFNSGTMRLDEGYNGGAMAILIHHEEIPYAITGARLWITNNSLPSFKVRLRVMEVSVDTGKPGKDLLPESIIQASELKRGWLEFPLVGKSIYMRQKCFYLVMEWVMDKEDRQLISEQLKAHLKEAPESLTEDNMEVGSEQVNEKRIKKFRNGVWFGTLIHNIIGSEYTCYYRLNENDSWNLTAAKLTAEVTVNNYN